MGKKEHLGIKNNLSILYLKVYHLVIFLLQNLYLYLEY